MTYQGWTPDLPIREFLSNRINSFRAMLAENPDSEYARRMLDAAVADFVDIALEDVADNPDTIAEAVDWAYGEGSDNTMLGQLRDAGFGEGGVM